MSTRTYYSAFNPPETGAGSKGSAAFLSAANTFIVYLYKRSATVLLDVDKPNGDVIYTFNPSNIDITAVTNGWTSTVPTGTDPLYLVGATATGTDATDTILSNEWTTPALLGAAGKDGLSTATVFLFQRNNTGTAPARPSADTTYTFATGILSGTYTGWSQTAPDSANGKYLYVTTATAISATATDTIPGTANVAGTEWAVVRLLAQDGTDGYTAYLTNESHTLAASSTGVVSAYTGANGEFVILKNSTQIQSNFTLSTVVTANPQTLTLSYTGSLYSVTGGFDAGEDVAFVTIRATGLAGGTYENVVIDKVFSLSKSKAGSNGEPAKLLTISSDKQAFTLNGSGVYTPSGQFITLTAKKQNTTQTVNWTTSPAITIKDTNGNPTTTGDTVRIYATDTGVNTAIEITATLTDGVVLTDKVTLVKIQDGAPGSNGLNTVILYLYQRASSAPALPSTPATYDFSTKALTGFNNGWSVTIPAGTLPLYVTAATASSTGTTDSIGSGEWASPVVLAKDGDTGPSGTNNATLSIYQRTATNTAPALPSVVGTTYTFSTGVLTGLDNGWTFKSLPTTGGSYRWISTATALSTGATDTIANTEWSAAALLAEDGISGLSGLLTNEAFTTSALSDGTGYTLTGSGGTFKVYSGTTDVTGSCTFSVLTTPNPTAGGLQIAIASTGVYTLSVPSTWTSDNESFTLQAIYNGTTISKVYSISKVKNGSAGAAGTTYTVTASNDSIKKNAAGALTPTSITFTATSIVGSGTPTSYAGRFIIETTTDGTTYTTQYTSATNESSYTYTVSASTLYVRAKLYLAGGTLTLLDQQSVSVISDGTNGTPGTPGANGTRVASLEMYRWSTTTPTTYPQGDSTYTWASNTFTSPTTNANSWTLVPGTGAAGQTLWGITMNVSNTLTDATTLVTWSSSTVYALGAYGSNGAAGAGGLSGLLTNENFTTSALSDGTGYTLTGSGGFFRVFSGATDVTELATYGVSSGGTIDNLSIRINPGPGASSNGVTVAGIVVPGVTGGTYALTGSTGWTGNTTTFTLVANYNGINIYKDYTISKAKAGAPGAAGASATSYSITSSIDSIKKSSAGVLTPTSVTFNAKSTTGAAGPVTYTGKIVIATSTDGTTFTDQSTTDNVSSVSYSPAASAIYVRATLYAPGTSTPILDTQSVSIIADGAPGSPGTASVTGVISNEAVVLYTYADGAVTSYAPAAGTFKMYNGTTDVTTSSTLNASVSGGTGSINAAGAYSITSMTGDTAVMTITGQYPVTTGVIITKIFTVTKSKAGYEIVGALPTGNLFTGRVVFLTGATENKLYRYITGTGWTKAADGADITPGSITTNKIDSGQITTALLAANSVTAMKLTMNSRPFYIPYMWFYGDPASNTLYWNTAQMKYYDNTGAQKSGQVNSGSKAWPGGQYFVYWTPVDVNSPTPGASPSNWSYSGDLGVAGADGNIVIGWYNGSDQWYPQYGQTIISGNFIQTGAIKAGNIDAGAVTAAKIFAGAVTTDKLAAGNITVSLGVGSTGKITLDGANNRILITD